MDHSPFLRLNIGDKMTLLSRSLETEWVNINLLSDIHIGLPNLVLMHSKIIHAQVSNSCDGTLNAIMHVICIAFFYPYALSICT